MHWYAESLGATVFKCLFERNDRSSPKRFNSPQQKDKFTILLSSDDELFNIGKIQLMRGRGKFNQTNCFAMDLHTVEGTGYDFFKTEGQVGERDINVFGSTSRSHN